MWKEIRLSFSRPLSEVEERILIAYFKTMTEKMKSTLKLGRSQYENPLVMGAAKLTGMGGAADTVKMNLDFILNNFYQYARLEKDSLQLYRFRVKEDFMKIHAPMGQTINLWERMQRKFSLKFKLELCKKIGIMPGELKIKFEDGGEDGADEVPKGEEAPHR